MAIRLDRKMLTGFVREAQSYLPPIRDGLAVYQQAPGQRAKIEEVVRYVQTIKGAAAMVGLTVLSRLTYYIAETLAEIATEQRPLDAVYATWLHDTVDQLEGYLDSLLAGDGQEQRIATEIERSFRQLQGAPPSSQTASATTQGDPSALPVPTAEVAARNLNARPETAEFAAGQLPELHEASSDPPSLLAAQEEALEGLLETRTTEPGTPVELVRPGDDDPPAQTELSDHSPLLSPANPGTLDARMASIDRDVQRVYGSVTARSVPTGGHPSERYVLFTLAGSRYAVPVPHVLEIGRVPPITPVPNVPPWLCGVINLRGDIVSVVDIRAFLDLEEGQPLDNRRLLVVKSTDETMVTSLLVDQVTGIVPLSATLPEVPQLPYTDRVAPYLSRVYEHDAQALAVFDLERFLLSPELRQFE